MYALFDQWFMCVFDVYELAIHLLQFLIPGHEHVRRFGLKLGHFSPAAFSTPLSPPPIPILFVHLFHLYNFCFGSWNSLKNFEIFLKFINILRALILSYILSLAFRRLRGMASSDKARTRTRDPACQ